jgi:2-polyprenyl-3-methyl-5-hydroxy-6-metoxy-1,4-benzoquinol methylase
MEIADRKAELQQHKSQSYFSLIRWDIISLIPAGEHKILEVGCGAGCTLRKLKVLGKANEIVGIEINQNATVDISNSLDRLHIGDIETMYLPYTEKYFDYILLPDVLEHLIDPSDVLQKCKNLLKDGGYVIATFPNLKHFSVLLKLILLDEFRYTDTGILDRSHLRFFTKKEILRMFKDEQLEVIDLISIPGDRTLVERVLHASKLNRLLNNNSFFAWQYLVKAGKKERNSRS